MVLMLNQISGIKVIKDKTTASRCKLKILTYHYELTQITDEPTHILEGSLSCIDLVFISQPNMVLNSGVHYSLHPYSHHQVVLGKFNLKVFSPSSYKRYVWH